MIRSPEHRPTPDPRAALLSLIPGLGQWRKGQPVHAFRLFSAALLLLGVVWVAGQFAGQGSSLFLLFLLFLPWWVIQIYDAYLPAAPNPSLWVTLRTVWARAHDIRFLGWLFLLTALTDLYVIVANPAYALTIFCAKPTGLLGWLAKAQSPTLHVLIGYGFMRLRPWSLLLYFVYAAFGFLNAIANFACLGYGRIRLVFLLTLAAFTAYVYWRRHCFLAKPQAL